MPARNARGERVLLYIGIIDILQSYRLFKKMEHTLKSVVQDAVSARGTFCAGVDDSSDSGVW